MKKHALDSFRTPPERLNCAQAVLHGYQAVSGNRTLALRDFKSLGGGRAPGGLCGALHAACCVLPEAKEFLEGEFVRRMGSAQCRELKASHAHACAVCVETAAELLAYALAKNAGAKAE